MNVIRFVPRGSAALRRWLLVGVLLASLHGAQAQLTLVNLGVNHQGALAVGAHPGFFNLTGGGFDIYDTWDSGAFAYQAVAGDFSVQVRVNSLEANAQWTKAGLMVRESLSESARMVFNRVTPPLVLTSDGTPGANNTRFAYRTGLDETAFEHGANGGRHEDGEGESAYPNAWLRIERVGSVISGYRSDDGVNWIEQGRQDTALWAGGPLPREVLVGLAVSKGPTGGPSATAQFREYNLEPRFAHEPLRVLSASSDGDPTGIKVQFNQPVSADAIDLWHWTLDAELITNARFVAADIIHLSIAGPLIEGQTYTLSISGLFHAETLEPLVPDPTVVQFTHGAGYEARRIRLERWNFIPGGSVEPILSSQAYALNLPDVVYSNAIFEDTTPAAMNYFSGRIFGVLTITNTGDYQFFACSDDSSVLFLSSDDQPAGKREIAREPEWNGSRHYAALDRRGPGRANVSAPIRLESGKRYWLEQVFADAASGNNASVAWRPPGAPEPTNGAPPIPESAFILSRFAHGTIFYTLGPPVFLVQPANQAVRDGLTATFAVRVDGTPPYAYQWQQRSGGQGLSFVNIAGATNAIYLRQATQPDNGSQFRCIVNNHFSGATSAVARLTVPPCLLGIAQQPANATVMAGQTVSFSVMATGAPPASTYQWQAGPGSEPFTNIPPATSSTLTLTAALMDNGAQFRCVVGNGCTNLASDAATLNVTLPCVSLNHVSITEGHQGIASAIFTVNLSQPNALPVSVTCVTSNGTAVAPDDYTPVTNTVVLPPGSLKATLAVPVVGDTLPEPDEYFLVHIVDATNAFFGSAVWEGRILNDDVPPVITAQPISQTAPVGSTVQFSITAINNPLRYQWYQNGQPLAGETNAILILTNVQTAALAFYDATASNDAGSDQSLTAELQLLLTNVGVPQPGLVARDNLGDVLQDEGGGFRAAGFVMTTTIPLSHGIPAIFTNVHATVDPGEMHCNVVGGHSMWSYYRRSNPATVSASTEGSDFDTVLAVYATAQLIPVSPIPCNNDCGNSRSSVVQFQALANTFYYLAVDGVGGATGLVQLTVSDALAPPFIAQPPASQTVRARSNVTFSVTAAGEPPLFYQWRTNGVPVTDGGRFSGATSTTLHITDVSYLDGAAYSVLITNCVGAVVSSPAQLTVLAPPEITLSPTSSILKTGSTATFRAAAIGATPLSYRWQLDGRDLNNDTRISGADTPNLTVRNVTGADERGYSLRVTNDYGSAVSLPAHLWVLEPPFISRQPQSVTSTAGSTVVLVVEASGIHPVSYEWQLNSVNVTGATSPTLMLPNLDHSRAGAYTVRVTDVIGTTTSATAMVTIGPLVPPPVPDIRAPQTSNAPNVQELTLQVGADLTLLGNITNSSTTAPAFQWYHNTKPLFGETNDTLVLTNLQPWVSSVAISSNRHVWTAGHYSVAATNQFGGATSSWCIKLAGELSLDTAPALIDGRPAIRIIATGNPGFILQGTPDLNPPTIWTNLALKCGATCFEYYLPLRTQGFRHFRAVPVPCP
jgi:hypothetical protein